MNTIPKIKNIFIIKLKQKIKIKNLLKLWYFFGINLYF